MRRLLAWWRRFCYAWTWANDLDPGKEPVLIERCRALRHVIEQLIKDRDAQRDQAARDWSRAVRRHQTLEAETKLRCDRMLAKLNQRAESGASERQRLETLQNP